METDGARLQAGAELVERDAWLDMFAAAPRSAADALGLASERVGGIGLLGSKSIPITELNRTVAIGVESAATTEDLSRSLAWLEAHGQDWAFQVEPEHTPAATLAWLEDHGLAPAGNGWAKFSILLRDYEPITAAESAIEVRRVDAPRASAYAEIVRTVFDLSATADDWFAALVGRNGWQTYLAYIGDKPVGSGAMFIKDGAAWLGMGTTLAEFRSRGVQSALLAQRISDARRHGLEVLTTETGYPAADERAFPSYRNVRRAGFAQTYVRANYKRQGR